jgi:hypothetical protein
MLSGAAEELRELLLQYYGLTGIAMSFALWKELTMQVAQLEEIAERLRSLKSRLQNLSGSPEQPLNADSEYVQAAKECDFMLPSPLTLGTLSETVERKLQNVSILMERARSHESLPEDAQAAAEQEYTMSDEDYSLNHAQHMADGTHGTHSEGHGRR